MKKSFLVAILFLAFYPFALSRTYYVSTDGSDTKGDGTKENPWLDWEVGIDALNAGDTLYIRGGTYISHDVVGVHVSGTKDNRIYIMGYPDDVLAGNKPILNCYQHCDNYEGAGTMYNAGLYVHNRQYLYFKDFDIINVYQCGDVISGAFSSINVANITYENIHVDNIGERGFYHTSGAWSSWDSLYAVNNLGQSPEDAAPIFPQPDTSRWINCDASNLCDSLSFNTGTGNGADGWKVISAVGNYYYWEGCRAWNYSDDGFDPNKGERVFINCWAMSSTKYKGVVEGVEGNGFKTSAIRTGPDTAWYFIEDPITKRQVKQKGCLAIFCNGTGFYHGVESDISVNPYWINNTAYKCRWGFQTFCKPDTIGDIYRNNISYASIYNDGTGQDFNILSYSRHVESHNTWDFVKGYPWFEDAGIVSDDDFVTIDSLELVALFTAPRQPDGSLPKKVPLQLKSTSDLIDAGTIIPKSDNVNFTQAYYGKNPDIGYYEYTPRPLLEIIGYSPNPTLDEITVRYYSSKANTINIEVVNNTGVNVLTMSHDATIGENNSVEIDLSNLPIGSYTIRLTDDSFTDAVQVTKKDPEPKIKFEILSCYPNPTVDLLSLEFNCPEQSNIKISVLDEMEHVVINEEYSAKKGQNKTVINLSTLQKSTYKVVLIKDTDKVSKNVIKL